MSRRIDFQQFLSSFARSRRFRNRLAFFVSCFACRINDIEEYVRGFLFLSLLAVNDSESQVGAVCRDDARIPLREFAVKPRRLILFPR